MTKSERAARWQEWEERVSAFRASGQSIRTWCTEQGIKEHCMWYWLRKFREEEQQSSQTTPSRWLKVEKQVSTSDFNSGVSLRIGSVVLDVQQGFDAVVLVDVVRALTSELC